MVRVDFIRTGLDDGIWNAPDKFWDAQPTDSTTTDSSRDMPSEIEQHCIALQALINDRDELGLHCEEAEEEDLQLMKAVAEDVAKELVDDLLFNPVDSLDLATEDIAASGSNLERLLVASAVESGKSTNDECRQPQRLAVPEASANSIPTNQQTGEELASKASVRNFSCYSFFANLFKPQLSLAAKSGRSNCHAADTELDRALLESASVHEAKQLSFGVARSRLQSVMEKYQAKVRPVEADGNCQFRALAHQLHGDEGQHHKVRAAMVQWLQKMKERYADFVHEPYDSYVERMACDGQWGDNVTLQAASDMLCRDIHILNDQPGGEHVALHPAENVGDSSEPQPPLWLTFISEVHYDAVDFF